MGLPEDPEVLMQRLGDLLNVVHERALRVLLEKSAGKPEEIVRLRKMFHMAALTNSLVDAVDAGLSLEAVEEYVATTFVSLRELKAKPALRLVPSEGGPP